MLTEAKIKAAIKAVTTEVTLNDKSEGRGAGSLLLVVRRLANGSTSATWFARVKRGGKRTKLALARYPSVSLNDARQMMRRMAPQLRDGAELKSVAPASEPSTVSAMFAAYVASMRAKGRASADEVERTLLTCDGSASDAFGCDTPAADVTTADVIEYVSEFYRNGHRGAADKARAYVSAAYGWAIKSANDYTDAGRRDWGVTVNPVANVKKDAGAMRTVDRALSADEMRTLWVATGTRASGFSVEVAACIRLLLCCGQRVQETLRIEDHEIDFIGALWNMPRHKTKTKRRAHIIPLPPQALDSLRALVELHGYGALFPSRSGDLGTIDHRSVNQAIARWVARTGAKKFTTRDLRRTWKSRTHDAGITRETRDLIQQHSKGDTGSKHYDFADYLPQMREAMVKWSSWIDECIINVPASSVDE